MAKTHRCPATSTRFCFVAAGAVGSRLPLRAAVDRKQKSGLAGAERVRWLGLRECRSAFACSPTRLVLLTCMCASVSAVFCKAVMEGDCAPLCPSRPPCGEKRDRERMIRVRQSRLATNELPQR